MIGGDILQRGNSVNWTGTVWERWANFGEYFNWPPGSWESRETQRHDWLLMRTSPNEDLLKAVPWTSLILVCHFHLSAVVASSDETFSLLHQFPRRAWVADSPGGVWCWCQANRRIERRLTEQLKDYRIRLKALGKSKTTCERASLKKEGKAKVNKKTNDHKRGDSKICVRKAYLLINRSSNSYYKPLQLGCRRFHCLTPHETYSPKTPPNQLHQSIAFKRHKFIQQQNTITYKIFRRQQQGRTIQALMNLLPVCRNSCGTFIPYSHQNHLV